MGEKVDSCQSAQSSINHWISDVSLLASDSDILDYGILTDRRVSADFSGNRFYIGHESQEKCHVDSSLRELTKKSVSSLQLYERYRHDLEIVYLFFFCVW